MPHKNVKFFFCLGLLFGVAFFRAPSPDARPVWLPEARDLGYPPRVCGAKFWKKLRRANKTE